jgi:hypothetical protein
LVENMLNYFASLTVAQAVEPGGKLCNVWGDIKRLY